MRAHRIVKCTWYKNKTTWTSIVEHHQHHNYVSLGANSVCIVNTHTIYHHANRLWSTQTHTCKHIPMLSNELLKRHKMYTHRCVWRRCQRWRRWLKFLYDQQILPESPLYININAWNIILKQNTNNTYVMRAGLIIPIQNFSVYSTNSHTRTHTHTHIVTGTSPNATLSNIKSNNHNQAWQTAAIPIVIMPVSKLHCRKSKTEKKHKIMCKQ